MSGNKTYCNGCRDDFYNHRSEPGFDGATECWSLKSAKVVTRYKLGWWTQPRTRADFTKVKTNSCHHAPGRYAMCETLPAHVLTRKAREKAAQS